MRIGLHVNDTMGHDAALDYCATVHPAVMKWLSPDKEIIRRCKIASPQTKHIGRVVHNPQTPDAYHAFQERVVTRAVELRGYIDYWEGYNEHIANDATPGIIRDFARLEVGLAKRLNAVGVGALIGGFSTGTLDSGKIDAFATAFEYMQAVGPGRCALHFHEYAGSYAGHFVKTPDGLNQWPDGGSWTGPSTDPGVWWNQNLRGWLLLRYRDLWPQLVARGWDRVRFFVTESGLDSVHKNPGGKKGWRDYVGTEWERVPGLGDYANQMRWYGWQASHDHYVGGIVDFGFGAPQHEWESFRLDADPAMLERFKQCQLMLPEGHIPSSGGATPATPAPKPVPTTPPAPAPAPAPRPQPPTSPNVRGVEARIQALRGDTWRTIAGRCLGRPAEWSEVRALMTANGVDPLQGGGLVTGAWLRSPWHKARRVEE